VRSGSVTRHTKLTMKIELFAVLCLLSLVCGDYVPISVTDSSGAGISTLNDGVFVPKLSPLSALAECTTLENGKETLSNLLNPSRLKFLVNVNCFSDDLDSSI
jgi:hypothetical protein